MRADALVRLAAVVVVPVEQGGRRAGRERQRVHRDGAGDVDFAGARHQPFAQHAHRQAGGAAVVVLHAGPALNGAGVALVFLDPAIDGERELGLLDDVLLLDVRRDAAVAGDLVELRLDFRRVAVDRLRSTEDFREIDGNDGNARSLQDLLAEAHRLEGAGTCADAADARVLQALDGAADAREAVEVGGELVAGDVGGMRRRVGEVDAVLVEVVAHRELAAERVAPAAQVDLVEFVVRRLHEHRHIELRPLDRFDDGDLVAEVGQEDDEAVDIVAVLVEQLHVLAHVFLGLDGAVVRRVDRQDVIADAELVELGDDVAPRVERQRAVEELAAGDDQAERDFLVKHLHCVSPLRTGRAIPRRPAYRTEPALAFNVWPFCVASGRVRPRR